MKTVFSTLGSLFSFSWVESYFIKKILSGGTAAAVAFVLTWAGKLSLAHYGINIDGPALQDALTALGTGGFIALTNYLKHAQDPK